MSAPVDVLVWILRQPCRCHSVAQLGERDPGCDRCQAHAAAAELIEAVRAIRATRGGIMALSAQDARTVRLWNALARIRGLA